MPVFGQNGFRMELDAFDGILPVTYTHDFAIFGPCRDLETIWQTVPVDRQRVITCHRKRVGQSFEYARIVVKHRRSLAMHDFFCMDDLAAESFLPAKCLSTSIEIPAS